MWDSHFTRLAFQKTMYKWIVSEKPLPNIMKKLFVHLSLNTTKNRNGNTSGSRSLQKNSKSKSNGIRMIGTKLRLKYPKKSGKDSVPRQTTKPCKNIPRTHVRGFLFVFCQLPQIFEKHRDRQWADSS